MKIFNTAILGLLFGWLLGTSAWASFVIPNGSIKDTKLGGVILHAHGGTDLSSAGSANNVLASDGTNWTSSNKYPVDSSADRIIWARIGYSSACSLDDQSGSISGVTNPFSGECLVSFNTTFSANVACWAMAFSASGASFACLQYSLGTTGVGIQCFNTTTGAASNIAFNLYCIGKR